eukprot:403373905
MCFKTSTILLYPYSRIAIYPAQDEFLRNHYDWYILIPYYCFYMFNWIVDIFVISDTISWRLNAHKDIKNTMFIGGKLSNVMLQFITVLYIQIKVNKV